MSAMKLCVKCDEFLDVSLFQKASRNIDGLFSYCKPCTKTTNSQWSRENRGRKTDKAREWNRQNRDLRSEYELVHKEKHPDRYRARYTLRNAVRVGKIERLPCSRCGAEPTEGHHHDYDKPLDVEWLCRTHHNEVHNQRD